MKYSVVIPVFNEAKNVAVVHAELVQTMNAWGDVYEIIFVNDGSTDNTADVLSTLRPLTLISLRKNFGQSAALDAGIKHSTGEIIITLDGDGQNPPSEIPKLLQVMSKGNFDVVSGWRKKRIDPLMKRFISRGANQLRRIFVKDGIHDSGCSLKVYKRECFENIDLIGEMHRFIPGMLSWYGFRVGETEVEHRPRLHGNTKYNWQRIVKSMIDILAISFWRKYSNRPLHLFGGFSFLFIGGGGALGVYIFIAKLFYHKPFADSNMPLLAVFMVFVGVQLFVSGLLADIAIRHYYSGERLPYVVREVITTSKKNS